MWAARGGAGQRALRHWAAPVPPSTAHPRMPLPTSAPGYSLMSAGHCPDPIVPDIGGGFGSRATATQANQFQGSCIDASVKEEKVAQKSSIWLRRSTFSCQCTAMSTLSWVRGSGGRFEDKRPDMQVCGTTCPAAGPLPPGGRPAFLFACSPRTNLPIVAAA